MKFIALKRDEFGKEVAIDSTSMLNQFLLG